MWRAINATTVDESNPPERKAPERHVRLEVGGHRAVESRWKLGERLALVDWRLAPHGAPVTADRDRRVWLPHERVPRRELPHTLVDRVRVGHVAEEEILERRAR
jgi:hypothetical protein